MSLASKITPWAPPMLSVMRIVTALLFLEHGTSKILGFPDSRMHPPLMSLAGVAGCMEIVGSTLLLFGFLSRPVAFLLSGEMAAAYFIAHLPHSFFPLQNGGDSAVLFCFVFLYIFFAGPGPWSVDAILGRETV